jgi:peroxiredoxin
MEEVSTTAFFGNRKVVLFSVPGAFTPTCSVQHLPGFVQNADAIKAKGVDEIVCIAVNDAFVMDAWGKSQNTGDSVTLLADGNGEFTQALGLGLDGTGFGLGQRSQRFAMVVENGTVAHLAVEEAGAFEVSSAERILAVL